MIHHIPNKRLIFLFIKGLYELLRRMVKISHPRTMDDTIQVAYNLDPIIKSLRGGPTNKAPSSQKMIKGSSKAKIPTMPRSDQLDATT